MQAREAARDAREHARDVQRHVLEMQEHRKDMELDLSTMALVQSELGGRTEIVKNASYTAEAVSESVQTLSKGNRIAKQTRALIARDSLGRTRQEKQSASPPELHVVVFARTLDPRVGETSYRLANLKREEPPAELSKVPADYKARR